jgi:multidrug transporter EmrE-like cation transporter
VISDNKGVEQRVAPGYPQPRRPAASARASSVRSRAYNARSKTRPADSTMRAWHRRRGRWCRCRREKVSDSAMAWIYVATTIILTVYGQMVVKWQVLRKGDLPRAFSGKVHYFTHLVTNPWVLSGLLGAVIAALCWMAAMSRLELSQAYPFVGLSFVMVLVLSGIFFGEQITVLKVAGVALVVVGVTLGSGLI